jgi:hypothetical protein
MKTGKSGAYYVSPPDSDVAKLIKAIAGIDAA